MPPGDLSPLLAEHVAPGTPALRCWPPNLGPGYGADAWGREAILPLTAAPAVGGEDWIAAALTAVRREGRPLHPESQRLLGATLAPGPRRSDGLPGYQPSGPDTGGAEAAAQIGVLQRPYGEVGADADYTYETGRTVHREIVSYTAEPVALPALPDGSARDAQVTVTRWRQHERRHRARGMGRNATAPIRDVLAAVSHDLLDMSASQVGEAVLGLCPNADRFREQAGIGARVPDLARRSSSWQAGGASPYTAWRRGRSILAQLGCWPWAHVADGKLPRRWRSDGAILGALRQFLATYGA